MNPNQTQVFSELITAVNAFYRRDISEYAVQIWWNAMRPYDFEAVKHAINRHCVNPDNGQFCPMPADIVKLLQGSTRDSALLAWSKVDKALRHIGTYRSVAFDDPIIHLVLQDMGGWIALGNKNEKDWPFVAKEFENRYRGYKQRDDVEAPKWLTGIAECENSVNGFDEEELVLIGDEREARKVVNNGTNEQGMRYLELGKVLAVVEAERERTHQEEQTNAQAASKPVEPAKQPPAAPTQQPQELAPWTQPKQAAQLNQHPR